MEDQRTVPPAIANADGYRTARQFDDGIRRVCERGGRVSDQKSEKSAEDGKHFAHIILQIASNGGFVSCPVTWPTPLISPPPDQMSEPSASYRVETSRRLDEE